MKIHKWKNDELNRLLMEKFNFGNKTLEETSCGNSDEENDREEEKAEEETINEMGCNGQGSRDGKECPECGKRNCPGKDGEKVNEDIGKKSVEMGADDNPEETKMDHLPDEVLKNIAKKKGKKGKKEDKKEKQEESFRAQIRKQLEEILKIN